MFKKIPTNITKMIGLFFYLIFVVGLSIFFFKTINLGGKIIVSNTGSQTQIQSGEVLGSGILQPIDEVYSSLIEGPATSYSEIIFPKQGYAGYSDLGIQNYIKNNTKNVEIPKNISGGYLYVVLNKPLKQMWMPQLNKYLPQSLNIKVNINGVNQSTYRIDTEQSLGVYEKDKEFLYDLKYVPIKGASTNDWLDSMIKKGNIKIGGAVSDTDGNYIEKIIFIWKY